jgi:hypothetical protein
MGVSTDAILVYGIPLKEGAIDEYYEGEGSPESGPSWMAYYGNEEDGLVIVSHCHGDFPMHILSVEGSEIRAWRGAAKRVDALPAMGNDVDEKLRAFVKKHKLAVDGKPGWWLASYGG